MKVKEFKKAFEEIAAGVPEQGSNSGQWKRVVALVEKLEEEAVKAPVAQKTLTEKK
jgi:hypothetical protein